MRALAKENLQINLLNYRNARRKEFEQELLRFFEGPMWNASIGLLEATESYIEIATTEHGKCILSDLGFFVIPLSKMEHARKVTISQVAANLAPLDTNRDWNRPSRFITQMRFKLDELAGTLARALDSSDKTAQGKKSKARKAPRNTNKHQQVTKKR
ncbi:MAG: hypothetical protein V4674_02505 [Patescibacteria group bacterium]